MTNGGSPDIHGSNNITVLVNGDQNTVVVSQGREVTFRRPRRRAIEREIDVLNCYAEAVPFQGREAEFALIERWLESPAQVSVLTLTGPGGAGKTRLAIELLRRKEETWAGGFLSFSSSSQLAGGGRTEVLKQSALLAVVDYASAQGEHLRGLLQDLAAHGCRVPRLRLLLLERAADKGSGWYQQLFDYSNSSDTLQFFDHGGEPVPLTAVTGPSELFSETLVASAAFHPGATAPVLEAVGLTDPKFGDPLVVMMAALAAWDTGVTGALALSRPDLAIHLARREKSRIENGVARRNLALVVEHLAAHSTLCGGFGVDAVLHVAREVSEGLGFGHLAGEAAEALVRLLPGPTAHSSGVLLPDIVGEAFVLGVGERLAVERAAARDGQAVAGYLMRALQDFIDPYEAWGKGYEGRAYGERSFEWIRKLAASGEPDLVVALATSLPENSVELRELAVELQKHLVDLTPGDMDGMRAMWLNNYGASLSEVGRREEALAAAAEALKMYRKLAADRPEAFLPYLAASLSNCGARLSNVGRLDEALAAAEEAVDTYRRLAATRPDAFLCELAVSLNNYGSMLHDAGWQEMALAMTAEAVDTCRRLTAVRPDAFLPDLASSLSNYGNLLSDVGRREEALAVAAEAVRIRSNLVAARPDAFLPDLATSLNNYGAMLSEIGQREEAIGVAAEAVKTYRKLATVRPDAFLPDLAMSLNNYGNLLSDVGRREEAIGMAAEAVNTYRELAAARPDVFLPGLARSLHNYGGRLRDVGRREAGLAAAAEAVNTCRQLVVKSPNAFMPELAMCLVNYGTMLSDVGQRKEALDAAAEAVDTCRKLVAIRPDAFLPDLAVSLNNYGAMLSEVGPWEDALAVAAEAVNTYGKLAEARPDVFLPDLAMSLNNYGNLLSVVGHGEEGLKVVAEALQIRRKLSTARPDSFLPDLALSLNNYGNLLSTMGRREDALAASTEAVDTYRGLAAAHPDAFSPYLARSLAVRGQAVDDPDAGAECFREAIEALAPHFHQLPSAHGGLMSALIGSYLEEIGKAGREPDVELLGPLLTVFEKLKEGESQ